VVLVLLSLGFENFLVLITTKYQPPVNAHISKQKAVQNLVSDIQKSLLESQLALRN